MRHGVSVARLCGRCSREGLRPTGTPDRYRGGAPKTLRHHRAALPIIVGLTLILTGCASALHLGQLRPSPLAASKGSHGPLPSASMVSRPPLELGIDIAFYASPGVDTQSVAQADIAYIKKLHANAVSIAFPFFMRDARSSKVYATSATPSPSAIATVARYAEKAGLYVSIRPLLDENNLEKPRTDWKPVHMAAWFDSYRRFLLPYAKMAQSIHIPEMVTGVELVRFRHSPYWASLDASLRRVYKGTLAYSNNWGYHLDLQHVAHVRQLLDAYRPLKLPNNASTAQVEAAWDAYGRTLPPGLVLSEVGIAAQAGAYTAPYKWKWSGEPLIPAIQVRWYKGVCHAVAADHLGGLYFWSLNFGQDLTAPPTVQVPGSFVAGPGAREISACFQHLSR